MNKYKDIKKNINEERERKTIYEDYGIEILKTDKAILIFIDSVGREISLEKFKTILKEITNNEKTLL